MATVERLQICLTPELNKRLTQVSKIKGTSKSKIIEHAVSEYLNALELIPDVQSQLNELSSLLDELGTIKKK